MVVTAALAGLLTRECFPVKENVPVPVPTIVTVHDTVKTFVKIQGPKVVTTDTVQLVSHTVLHDTVQIPVNVPDTNMRPHLWPVLSAMIGEARGDSSRTLTFSLRSGKTEEATVWTPGALKSIWADSGGVPRMDFYPPPKPYSVSIWTKAKWLVIGAGTFFVIKGARDAIH